MRRRDRLFITLMVIVILSISDVGAMNTSWIQATEQMLRGERNYLAIYEDAMADARNRHERFLNDSEMENYIGVAYSLCDISGDGFKELIVMQREGKFCSYLWVYGCIGNHNAFLGEIVCDPDYIYGYKQGILYMDAYKKGVSLHIVQWDGTSFTDNIIYQGTKGSDDPAPPVYELSDYFDKNRLLEMVPDFLPFDDVSQLVEYPDSPNVDLLDGSAVDHVDSLFVDTANADNGLYDVIDEYKQAINNYKPEWTYEYIEGTYPRVNATLIFDTANYPGNSQLFYSFYDLDGNGKDELLIGRGSGNTIGIHYMDVFTSDGYSAVRFFDNTSIGARSGLDIYTDGTIQFSGANSAAEGTIEYWRIADDGIHPYKVLRFDTYYDSDGPNFHNVEGSVDPFEYTERFKYMDLLELDSWEVIVDNDLTAGSDGKNNGASKGNDNADTSNSYEYILPDSSTQYLTEADVAGLDPASLRIARNEIYARHGRRFKSEDLQTYFNGKSWYSGTIAPDSFSEKVLSDIEKSNIKFIEAHEN